MMRHGRASILTTLVVMAAIVPPASQAGVAPLPDNRLGIRTAPLLLLSRPDVQADLKLEPAQIADAERAITDLYVRASALKGMTGDKALNARREIDEEQQRWLESRLTEPQRQRLDQIDLQWEGSSSLISRQVVAGVLELSPEQRAQLTAAVEESRRLRAAGKYQWSDERALGRKALGILTQAQRERWSAILGRPFTPRLSDANLQRPAQGR